MGGKSTKPKKMLKKFDIEIVCKKVYHHLNLIRDRKIGELKERERKLRDEIKKGRVDYHDVIVEMIHIVNLFKYITASTTVMRYCEMVQDRSMSIVDACRSKNLKPISDLETYFQGIIWSSDKLNLTTIREFNQLVFVNFGPEIFKEMQSFSKVDKNLRECFATVEPLPNEIKAYLEQFCNRYDIDGIEFGGKKTKQVSSFESKLENFDDVINNLKTKPGSEKFDSIYKQPSNIPSINQSKSNVNPPRIDFDLPDESELESKISKESEGNNLDGLTDDHIKGIIESNIQQSYFKSKKSKKEESKIKEDSVISKKNMDDLISKLKKLGVSGTNFKNSNVKYDAQKHYKGEGENEYGVKLDGKKD